MSDKINIDKLFEDSLGNAEFSPDSSAWENISQNLDSKPKSIVFRSRYKIFMSYAASVIVLALTSFLLIRSCNNSSLIASNSTSKEIVETTKNNSNANVNAEVNKNRINDNPAIESINEINRVLKESKSENINNDLSKVISDDVTNEITEVISNNSANNIISDEINEEAEDIYKPVKTANKLKSKIGENSISFSNFKTISNRQLLGDISLLELDFKHDPFKYRIASNSIQSSYDFTFGPANNISSGSLINDNHKRYKYLSNNAVNSYNYSLNYKFELNKYFVKTGFNILNTGEIADLEITNRYNDTSSSFMDYTINQYYTYDSLDWWVDPNNPNDTLVVYESILHTDTIDSRWVRVDSFYNSKSNRVIQSNIRYVELPLIVGYRHQFGSRFSMAVSAGVGLAIKTGDEGFFINEGELTKITKENSPYRDIAYNMIINMRLQYKLSNRFSLIAVPTYRKNLTSIYKENFGVNRLYESYSLNFGVNYIIN